MQTDLLDLVCCPSCGGDLLLEEIERQHGEVWEGLLRCQRCEALYPVDKGMPHLYIRGSEWVTKATEADGWVTIHQEMGIYEQSEDAVDLQIPYYPEEPWIQVARSFDMALEQLQLTGDETVLDLGAGRGWAAKQFALRGCRVVALDVVADENVGLGRARALMDHAGTYFERVIGDGEQLPFRPQVFDLVFCAAALHHTSDLPLFMRNIARVVREGGQLCAINEPSISILEREADVLARDAADELRLGINENRPNILRYQQALTQAGFTPTIVMPASAYGKDDEELSAWAQDLGALWVAPWSQDGMTPRGDPIRLFWRVYNFVTRRLRGLFMGMWPLRQEVPFKGRRERTAYAILLWSSGELFLLATRQENS